MPRVPWRKNRRTGDAERALAAAARLVADGRLLDAIDRLSAANATARDRTIERRLVELRSDAFLDRSWSGVRPVWPDSVPDSFPGVLVPEVTRDELTVEHLRSAMQHHGVLLIRGLVDQARVALLVADIDRALTAYDAYTDGVVDDDLDGWYEPFVRDHISNRAFKRKRGSVMTVEPPPTMFDLLETFEAVGASRVVREYFGEPPMLLARKGTLRRISHEGSTGGWHQDGAFMGVDIRSLNIWLALTHCGDDAPGLDIVARRLTELVSTGEGAFAWASSPDAAEKIAAGTLVRPVVDAGDALIFDHLNLHRTAIDPGMQRDRHAIETWLFSPSTYDAMTTSVDDGYSPRDQIPIVF